MRRLNTKRLAFTLTELLVVLALIVVLGALGMGAASKGYGWVKQRATETTMTKVLQRIVQRRVSDIYKEAREWATPVAIYEQAAGDGRRAEVLKVLYLYKWSFPQTYSESWFNFQESLALYDNVSGYPVARTIYQRLFSRSGVTPAQFIATPTAQDMSKVIGLQGSACLIAAFASCRASSLDELTPEELSQPDLANGNYDIPIQATLPSGAATTNQLLVDAWGSPFFFLRHGNFWDNLGAVRGAINRAPFQLGLVAPPITPIPAVLGDSYYDILVNSVDPSNPHFNRGRAFRAFTSRWNQDPFDPEGLLRNSETWRVVSPQPNPTTNPVFWLVPPPYLSNVAVMPHLARPAPTTNFTQNQDYLRSTFGYRPQLSNLANPGNPPDRWAQEYAPFVIISAGGDGLFKNWDDNLDSYRLQINVSSQQ